MTTSSTKPPVAMDIDDVDARQPFTVGLTAATSVGLSARWVHYSGVSPVARAAAEFLTDSATMQAHGDQAPILDRERLAYHIEVGRADKVAPFLKELVAIGFLTIYGGGVDQDTGKRRQRRDKSGRPIPDRFSIALEPPAGYVGPKNRNESDAEFIADRDAAYRAAKESGKRVRTGNITIRRAERGRLETSQVTPDTGIRGQGETADPGFWGQLAFPQVTPDTENRGQGETADPGSRGQLTFQQVNTDPKTGGHLQIDRSSISEGEIEGSIEPVPGGTAEPPATGWDERRLAEVREVARALPLREWHVAHGKPDWVLSTYDTDRLQQAICAAMDRSGMSLEQARAIGQAAASEAKKQPVTYVLTAFGHKLLATWLRRVMPEPAAREPLPLLGATAPTSTLRPADPAESSPTPAALGKCPECRAEPDAPRLHRQIERPDGSVAFCPVCCPPSAG